ncbi:DUF2059 domain-containing protein [Chitinophaga nivalis]|uniref:DUF2059 domain-containing protein n=1 Tax=Chitinophaga nivalis TaxID=2991709 RepID=A0ABT3IJX4_9BACT|nr:DUF2059 domain-containing protein [Chitinophaga nivalis]MCW3466046.1 DUF2059 domain-containing protein [Chitinophaga nivalis]MCW3484263.1 DUF2059 domain-containing protein [Chitinophaga nivalis]
MKKLLIILVLLGWGYGAFSQTTDKDRKIKTFLELTGAGKLGVQLSQHLIASFKGQFTAVPAEFWEKATSNINADELINLSIPIYAKYYTTEDIDELIRFYKTPVGQKAIQVTPLLMQESMEVGKVWGQQLAQKILKELEEKGYKKAEN